MKPLLLGLLSLACGAHAVFCWRELQLPRPHAKSSPVPLPALVWLLVPLANYLVHNPEFFSFETSALLLLVLLLLPLAVLMVMQRLQIRLWRRDVAVPLGVAFFYVFYSWPALTAALQIPVETSIFPRLLVLAAVWNIWPRKVPTPLPKRASVAHSLLPLMLATSLFAGCGPIAAPPGVASLSKHPSAFQAQFDQEAGVPRLVLLLSPA